MKMNFNLGFLCGGLFAVIGFIILASMSSDAMPVNDFPPRKPPVVIEGRDCYIGDKLIAPSDQVFISMEDLK